VQTKRLDKTIRVYQRALGCGVASA